MNINYSSCSRLRLGCQPIEEMNESVYHWMHDGLECFLEGKIIVCILNNTVRNTSGTSNLIKFMFIKFVKYKICWWKSYSLKRMPSKPNISTATIHLTYTSTCIRMSANPRYKSLTSIIDRSCILNHSSFRLFDRWKVKVTAILIFWGNISQIETILFKECLQFFISESFEKCRVGLSWGLPIRRLLI